MNVKMLHTTPALTIVSAMAQTSSPADAITKKKKKKGGWGMGGGGGSDGAGGGGGAAICCRLATVKCVEFVSCSHAAPIQQRPRRDCVIFPAAPRLINTSR